MNALRHLWGEGTLLFKGLSLGHAALFLLGAAALLALAWRLQVGSARAWTRRLALGLRLSVLFLLLLALMEPVLRQQKPVPHESFLIHLVDTSQSMGLKDYEGQARLDALRQRALVSATMNQRLQVDYRMLEYGFDEALRPVKKESALQAGQKATDLAGALRSLQGQVAGLPLAGVILYSDGNPTAGSGDRKEILEAAAQLQTPVYVVGGAPLELGPDYWVDRIIQPGEVAASVATKVTVLVGTHDLRDSGITVILSEGRRELERKIVYATARDQTLQVPFTIHPAQLGMIRYHVKLEGSPREAYPWNNEQDFHLRVHKEKRRMLYVEGSPRYEYRFLRAAFEADERFELSSMIFLDDQNLLYRQGIRGPDELKNGFPKTEEELFAYDIVVIGDVPAARFTQAQLAMLREFVRKRGGGLMFLAGEHSFASDGYEKSLLAEVLPFSFDRSPMLAEPFRVRPTAEGTARSMFGASEKNAATPWQTLPPLTELYPLGGLKPGAVRLCEVDKDGAEPMPLVAYQRYGLGTSLVCGISATWPWKFRTESDNPSYSAFWKQMALILLERADGQIRLEVTPLSPALGAEVTIQGAVLDRSYKADPAAPVKVQIESPDGKLTDLPTQAGLSGDITFRAKFKPAGPGAYRVIARGGQDAAGAPLMRDEMFVVQSAAAELREVRLNEALLREIATTTGGDYVHLSEFKDLPGKIKPRPGARVIVKEHALWDRPFLLLALLGLLLGEWTLRRLGNLA